MPKVSHMEYPREGITRSELEEVMSKNIQKFPSLDLIAMQSVFDRDFERRMEEEIELSEEELFLIDKGADEIWAHRIREDLHEYKRAALEFFSLDLTGEEGIDIYRLGGGSWITMRQGFDERLNRFLEPLAICSHFGVLYGIGKDKTWRDYG